MCDCAFACTAGCVIKTSLTSSDDTDRVWGLTAVDDELFALLYRDNQVDVYSINDYQLLRHIRLPGLTRDSLRDLTSCVRHKCLCASHCRDSCIHRYDLSSSAVSKWSVPGKPIGLSVIPGNWNLLVTCDGEPSKLVELRADSGQYVREITRIFGTPYNWPLVSTSSVMVSCQPPFIECAWSMLKVEWHIVTAVSAALTQDS